MQPAEILINEDWSQEVADVVRFLHLQGWTPATSSNFSYRNSTDAACFYVSMSGLDKGDFSADNFLEVDLNGKVMDPKLAHIRPSAETLLHAMLYRMYPQAQVVLHTHSANGTVISKLYEREQHILLKDFEILKGLEGIRTHEDELRLPVFPNDQDMGRLSALVETELKKHHPLHGFLLAGHGLYTWGETPAQAKRHVEVFEFLFDCILKLRSHGYADYSG